MDIVVLDMRKAANFCDYFVVCTGNTDRQVRAVAIGIEQGLDDLGHPAPVKQGSQDARWIILDLSDVVVHIFDPEAREFYGLEHLWQDAKPIKWE
jgi:ribosome-associated protein